MKKTVILLVALVILVCFGKGHVYASLIGDTVIISHQVLPTYPEFDGPYSVLVLAGDADRIKLTPYQDRTKAYGVDVEANSIFIDFTVI